MGMIGVSRRSRLLPVLRYSMRTGSMASVLVRDGIVRVSPALALAFWVRLRKSPLVVQSVLGRRESEAKG